MKNILKFAIYLFSILLFTYGLYDVINRCANYLAHLESISFIAGFIIMLLLGTTLTILIMGFVVKFFWSFNTFDKTANYIIIPIVSLHCFVHIIYLFRTYVIDSVFILCVILIIYNTLALIKTLVNVEDPKFNPDKKPL
ncbi:hypothetical protein GJU43_11995 [Flavobacterium sp. LC2016-23]|uniref:hypothetical protein n=1 Tax=Flavobacterium sp. LC2016-23 TaxID=2666330 RepID=UPI0012AF0154|nr:hypothetical protein [Flavobacterium sp. LC2016-23]MRX39999.1 hypothetical protein [Flavobacterium sp. LC2016-23]